MTNIDLNKYNTSLSRNYTIDMYDFEKIIGRLPHNHYELKRFARTVFQQIDELTQGAIIYRQAMRDIENRGG